MRRRRQAIGAASAALLLGAVLGGPAPAIADASLDLRGTWFVVVHYRDSATANPEAERWEDQVWTFEELPDGGLRWTQYPIVVFQDTSGRFEAIPGNPRSRVLDAWWPNETQRAELEGGPRVNQRGSRSKELEGSDAEGWSSDDPLQVRSATAIGFQRQVRIEDPDGRPVFRRVDRTGTAARSRTEGTTVYRTEEVRGEGRELRGSYTKDGHRVGRFRMIRTPAPRGLLSSEEEGTVHQRFQRRMLEEALRGDEGPGPGDDGGEAP